MTTLAPPPGAAPSTTGRGASRRAVSLARLHTASLLEAPGVIDARVEITGPPDALVLDVRCRLAPGSDTCALVRLVEEALAPALETQLGATFAERHVDVAVAGTRER